MPDSPQAVIMAAGQGKRMRSATPKVLHELCGRPILEYVIAAAQEVGSASPVLVVSPEQPAIAALGKSRGCEVVPQASPRGTGDAVRAVPADKRSNGVVLVLSGDAPLVQAETLQRLLDALDGGQVDCAVASVAPTRWSRKFGLLELSKEGAVTRIVEDHDGTSLQPRNAGIYAFTGAALWPALEKLQAGNAQSEYYLTDVMALLNRAIVVPLDDDDEAVGVDDRLKLAYAQAAMRRRINERLMETGVTLEDPASTYIDVGVTVGPDSVIRPMTVIRGQSQLGRGCEIGPLAQLHNVVGGDRVTIGASSLEDCRLGDDVTIGAFNRIRPDTVLASGVWLGTHAEVKNSRIGAGSRISHFSCVLDADVGANVNIGAGTVTCNFDGTEKHHTKIDDGVFVGSNATLVAPLHIESGAYIAAGSYVGKDVPPGSLAVGRSQQRNIEGWAQRRRDKEPI